MTELFSTHNPQNSTEQGNAADCADSAYRDAEAANSRLLEDLAGICRGLGITPAEVKGALAPEDIADWRQGVIGSDTLASFAYSLEQRREMDRGKRLADDTAPATCRRCGPIWLWFSGEVLGCPWCWNRVADRPIPRPVSVHCGDCLHFEHTNHRDQSSGNWRWAVPQGQPSVAPFNFSCWIAGKDLLTVRRGISV